MQPHFLSFNAAVFKRKKLTAGASRKEKYFRSVTGGQMNMLENHQRQLARSAKLHMETLARSFCLYLVTEGFDLRKAHQPESTLPLHALFSKSCL